MPTDVQVKSTRTRFHYEANGSSASAPTRPALRYFGAKWRLAPWIIAHFPVHRCFVEPFAGGASILLRKSPSECEVLNDLDQIVVSFFRVLRERPAELIRALELTPFSRVEYDLSYQSSDDELEQARRLYVRAWQARGGPRAQWRSGWRYQRNNRLAKGSNSVEQWGQVDHLWAVAARLRHVQIECDDALAVIQRFDAPDTLVYADPPYVASVRSERWRAKAYTCEMTDDDHRRLADVLHGIRGMAILSGYGSPLYDELFGDWRCETIRAITDMNTSATECLWLNPAAAERANQLRLDFDESRPSDGDEGETDL